MNANVILFNKAGRLRSGWRFAVFIALFFFASAIVGGVAYWLFEQLQLGYTPGSPEAMALNGVISLAIALLVGWICNRFLEGLPFRALGAAFTQGWLRNLAIGIGLGAAAISLAMLIAFVFGGLSFRFNSEHTGSAMLATIFGSLIVFIPAAAFEEALFRGYILQTFARSGLAWLAIALTAIFFGIVHLGNPGAGMISSLNTALAGAWFGVAYLKTRDLWFPFGLHLIWNWMQGSIFGVEVSGLTELAPAPLLREIDGGPAWLTGGEYGIEGGMAATIALIVSTAAIYFLPDLEPSPEMLAMTSRENPTQSVS